MHAHQIHAMTIINSTTLNDEDRYNLIKGLVENSRIDSEAFITPDVMINTMQRLMDKINRTPIDLVVSTFSDSETDTPVKYEVYLGIRLARIMVYAYYPFINIEKRSTYQYARHLALRVREHFKSHKEIPTDDEIIRFIEKELIKLKISKRLYCFTRFLDYFTD